MSTAATTDRGQRSAAHSRGAAVFERTARAAGVPPLTIFGRGRLPWSGPWGPKIVRGGNRSSGVAPDLGRSKGWSTVGAVNRGRLAGFRDYLRRGRPADSLVTLISSHERLRDPRRNADAYAEAWALNFFLIRQREKQYLAYIKMLSEKGPLLSDDPETRLLEFNQAFGNLEQLDAEFLRHMSKVR